MEEQQAISINDVLMKLNELINALENIPMLGTKRFLSKREAAAYIDKTTSYIDKLIWSKEIPYYQPSSHVIYIDKADLDRYITKTRFKSNQEIQREAKIPKYK